ncbi:MAG: DUF348 domain-containing protein [Clostridiales bacterium]|jgi:uncharacterized protein YabE (DUF348 family)|nr:DUF348 domain-containing protein [Clostridiales bacterium]
MDKITRSDRFEAATWIPVLFLITAGMLVLFSVHLSRKEVRLLADGHSRVVYTYSHNVAGVLSEAGIEPGKYDMLSHQPEERTYDGMEIKYRAAFPITVAADGNDFVLWAAETTAGQALQSLGVTLGELDRIQPGADEKLQSGDTVEVIRVSKHLITQRSEIPFREIRRTNESMDRGESRVLQRGVTGLREDTVEVTMENGEEVDLHLVQSEIIRVKQDRVVEHGGNTLLSRAGRSFQFNQVIHVTATAYCPGTAESGCPIDEYGRSKCTGHFNDGITATGIRATAGNGQEGNPHIVAVDPRVIPLGSRLYIDGYGFAVAADVGGAIKGNRIDLLIADHSTAWKFGRKRLRVYLLPQEL